MQKQPIVLDVSSWRSFTYSLLIIWSIYLATANALECSPTRNGFPHFDGRPIKILFSLTVDQKLMFVPDTFVSEGQPSSHSGLSAVVASAGGASAGNSVLSMSAVVHTDDVEGVGVVLSHPWMAVIAAATRAADSGGHHSLKSSLNVSDDGPLREAMSSGIGLFFSLVLSI